MGTQYYGRENIIAGSFRNVNLLNDLSPVIITGGIVHKGAYAAGTDYIVGDVVSYNGSSYVMYTDAAAGTLPTNTTYWQVVANMGNQGFQGHIGNQGNQGFQGSQGFQGNQGFQGIQGHQGIQGVQGVQGVQGHQGNQGNQGNQGSQGSQGNQSSVAGPQGNQGNQGAAITGAKGDKGDTGSQGTQGNQGIQGTNGVLGGDGAQGNQGVRGYQGYQGSIGNDSTVAGPQGNQGSNGTNGTNGSNGAQGSQGVQGLKGDTGNTGSAGSQGSQGSQGSAGTNGTNGTNGNQGVQGAVGSQGNQGTKGDTGTTGNTGSNGAQGTQGNQGGIGSQGNQGTAGSNGSNGAQGNQGSQGSQGIQGVQGIQGSQGFQGLKGNQGFQGTAGTNGSNGSQGNQGYQGFQGNQSSVAGAQGSQGYQGSIGNQGYQGNQGTTGGNSFINSELVNESPNGSTTAFTVDNAYIAGSTTVYKNGVRMRPGGADYTETTPSTGTITFVTAPATGSVILVDYQKSVSTTGNADTLDGYHANATPTANQIPVLDAGAKLPIAALPYQNFNSMSYQAFINGNFDVWQRGTSVALANTTVTFLSDRWSDYASKDGGTLPTLTRSRQLQTSGDLYGSYYFTRLTTNGAGSSFGNNSYHILRQKIENGVRNLCGNGKKITVSFYAKSDIANKKIGISYGQTYGSGGSPSGTEVVTGTTWTLTSSWVKYTYTFTTNTLSGKTFGTANDDLIDFYFFYQWGSTSGTTFGLGSAETYIGSGNIDIAQVQLCSGDVALPFMATSYEDELRKCQRYCFGIGPTVSFDSINVGFATDTTHFVTAIKFPVKMRTTPVLDKYDAADWQFYDGGGTFATSALSLWNGNNTGPDGTALLFTTSGATQYRPAMWMADGTPGRILTLSAEL